MIIAIIKAWLQAARLPSQSYIFIPLLLGQSFYYTQTGIFNFNYFLLIQLFGIANQLYIVFANDFADRNADALNETFTIFSGGSRVLVEKKIKPKSIFNAAMLMAGFCIIISSFMAYLLGNISLVLLAIVAILLLQMYSYHPFRLSYRGGGEFLQMLGVGAILPLYGFIAQGGSIQSFPLSFLFPLLLINLSCAMATSLPDQPSDQLTDKKTMAVTFGIPKAQTIILIIELIAYCYFLLLIYFNITRTLKDLIYLLPFAFICFSLVGRNAKPGNWLLSGFVFFSISFNLSIQILLIVTNFRLM